MARGTNFQAVRSFNQIVVLDAIRRSEDGLSRVELAELTGLATQTVSNVSRRLLDEGFVVESGKVSVGRGKPRITLDVAPLGRVAVGVHLDPAVITTAVVGLRGEVIAHLQVHTPDAAEPSTVIELIDGQIKRLLRDAGVDRDRVLGIGIASPGPIDAEGGFMIDPPLLAGWTGVPLRDDLARVSGLPVVFEKDVNAAVVAELWLADEEVSNDFAFVYFGSGIGIGLAFDGEVYRGLTGNAGEGGTIWVREADSAPDRRDDMLGMLAAPAHLVAEARRAGLYSSEPGTEFEDLDSAFRDLVELAEHEGGQARDLVNRAADMIGDALVSVVNLLDIPEVVFGGPYWSIVAERCMPRIEHVLATSRDRVTDHSIALRMSAMSEDVTAVGAGCLVFNSILSSHPASLLLQDAADRS